jgi:hypothetical protein
MSNDDKDALERQVLEAHGVAPGQVYLDNDKREKGLRRIKVLGVTLKPGKASCANCDRDGRNLGRTLWISFERLANKRLYTRIT